jgi:DNA-directed RNA polymerase II subunit RPB2
MGTSASLIPLPEHNQGPRNTFQTSMGNQSMGVVHSNLSTRFDTTAKSLAYPNRPLFETQMYRVLGLDEMPAGQTVIVAIMTYGGFNQEDSIIFNQGSIDRGLFLMVVTKSYKAIAKSTGNSEVAETFEYPAVKKGDPMLYEALDSNGIARVGADVGEGYVLISKKRRIGRPPNHIDSYEQVVVGVGITNARVDKVMITTNAEGNRVAFVRIRQVRKPEEGDKFAPRHAQKGTAAAIYPEEDMPEVAYGPNKGMRPDIIVNPHSIPSRMTIAWLIEIIASKLAALTGERLNATAFRRFDVNQLMANLRQYGFSGGGKEILKSGTTGKLLRDVGGKRYAARIFIGPCYYQALRHNVLDKIQMRQRGPVKQQHRQPVSGRANRGGQRLGEMERDALISHGASALLRERLCLSSDAYTTVFCSRCGTVAIANHEDNSYTCRTCGDDGKFGTCTIPYAYKLLLHLLSGAGFRVTHKMREVPKKVTRKYLPPPPTLTLSKVVASVPIVPLRRPLTAPLKRVTSEQQIEEVEVKPMDLGLSAGDGETIFLPESPKGKEEEEEVPEPVHVPTKAPTKLAPIKARAKASPRAVPAKAPTKVPTKGLVQPIKAVSKQVKVKIPTAAKKTPRSVIPVRKPT